MFEKKLTFGHNYLNILTTILLKECCMIFTILCCALWKIFYGIKSCLGKSGFIFIIFVLSISMTLAGCSGGASVRDSDSNPAWSISLDPAGDYTFPTDSQDYIRQIHTVTVTNTGTQPTGDLTIDLSGTNSGSFTLSKNFINSIVVGGSDSFTVQPATGFLRGAHRATVVVSGNNGIQAAFNIRFDARISSAYWRAGSTAIIGKIPSDESSQLYKIQLGAFKKSKNAKRVFDRLNEASLNPIYEKYRNYTRVILPGIPARDVADYLEKIQELGFREAWIKADAEKLPVSTAALPIIASNEIGFRTIRVGETKNISDLAKNKNVVQWSSSTPSAFTVNSNGDVKGISIGNGFVSINENDYISIAVVPTERFYVVKDSQVALLQIDSKTGSSLSKDITEYRAEPTYRLAYRFNNKGEKKGASGDNGGIDIIARGENYKWLWTTYYQGGWFYDLLVIMQVLEFYAD